MDEARLQAYAELIVKKGINPDPGQDVLIIAGLDQPEFVRLVVKTCYENGAGKVVVDWTDMPCGRLDQLHQSEERLSTVEPWELAKFKWRAEKLPALLWLDSDDPDGMDGIDQGKRARAQQARYPVIKPFRDAMENRHQWCIAGVPGRKWARKVFPGLPAAEAEERLWRAILTASRADGDPIADWNEHNKTIHGRTEKLNALNLAALEYRSSNGTNLRVGLIPQGIFAGAAEKDLSGREFNPNIPSEEIFTSPMRGNADGVVRAVKPLSWQGSLINDFAVTFENGRAVKVEAARGRETLEKIVSMDEGAAFLGECALIDKNSPINASGILFYNTLFDENACCHLALGRGFENCIRDYGRCTLEELRAMGINDSMIHVDFMIGAPDLDIDGITSDGRKVPLFRDGSWAV